MKEDWISKGTQWESEDKLHSPEKRKQFPTGPQRLLGMRGRYKFRRVLTWKVSISKGNDLEH